VIETLKLYCDIFKAITVQTIIHKNLNSTNKLHGKWVYTSYSSNACIHSPNPVRYVSPVVEHGVVVRSAFYIVSVKFQVLYKKFHFPYK